jgi:o-succinylbenzoate---CoA ligase
VLREVRPLPMPTGDRLLDVLDDLAAALCGSGPVVLPVPTNDPARAVRLSAALGVGSPLAAGEDDPDDPTAFVVATSGSVGTPKAALLPVSALRASIAATARGLAQWASPADPVDAHALISGADSASRSSHPGSDPASRSSHPGSDPASRSSQWLLTLPAEHIAGLQVLLRSVAAGSVPTVLDTSVPFTAERFLDAAGRISGGPRYASLVPTQLHRILLNAEATAALAEFDAVLVGGDAAPADLIERAEAAGIRTVVSYGMTETCGGCVYDGRPLEGVEIALQTGDVADNAENGMGPEQRLDVPGAGRIDLSGPVIARGYRNRPRDRAFALGTHRTFRTSDHGVLRNGALIVLGRLDDVLISGGIKVDPAAVESALSGAPGVAEVVVVGIPHAEWGSALTAVVTREGDAVPDLDTLRTLAATALGPAAAPRHLLVVPDFPTIGPGKPDRAAIRELAAHALAADW